VLDALESGPKTFGELRALPALAGETPKDVMDIMTLLSESEHAQIYFTGQGAPDNASAAAFNDAMLARNGTDNPYQVFASPLIGGGVRNGLVQRLVYHSLRSGTASDDVEAVTDHVYATMKARGVPIGAKGAATAGEGAGQPDQAAQASAQRAEVAQSVAAILKRRLPIWNQLEVLQ
ncbi:MAG: hypothetical protein ACRYF5_07285, partial [Janthinobacterium lividum]